MIELKDFLEIIVLIAIAVEIYTLSHHAKLEHKIDQHLDILDKHMKQLDEHIAKLDDYQKMDLNQHSRKQQLDKQG